MALECFRKREFLVIFVVWYQFEFSENCFPNVHPLVVTNWFFLSFLRVSRGLPGELVQQFFSNLSKLVQPEYVDDIYTQILTNLTELNYTTEKLMFEVMQPCSIMLEKCIWLGLVVPCETIFRVAKSSEGFCCSFNYNGLKDNLEV